MRKKTKVKIYPSQQKHHEHRQRLNRSLQSALWAALAFVCAFVAALIWSEYRIQRKINEYDRTVQRQISKNPESTESEDKKDV